MPVDRPERVLALADRLEPRLRRRFLEIIEHLKGQNTLAEIERLVAAGLVEEALPLATLEAAALSLSAEWAEIMTTSARETAGFIGRELNVLIDFDRVNVRAVQAMGENRLRLIREFSDEQRLVLRRVMSRGVELGLNPREQARMFRSSIGLTEYQERAVANYRSALRRNSSDALDRQLRDRRFDRTVRRAIRTKQPLSDTQIERMVERYRESYLRYRSEIIARTETLDAVHAGNEEMYRQAVDGGHIDPQTLLRTWDSSQDARVRASHSAMHGQQRRMDEPFVSGLGNLLMRPLDPNAPAEDRIACRCAELVQFEQDARSRAA